MFLTTDQNEANSNPINAAIPNPAGQAGKGFPQQGQTEEAEYVALIINHHRKNDERYIFPNASPIRICFVL
jgi:hypothetical protein